MNWFSLTMYPMRPFKSKNCPSKWKYTLKDLDLSREMKTTNYTWKHSQSIFVVIVSRNDGDWSYPPASDPPWELNAVTLSKRSVMLGLHYIFMDLEVDWILFQALMDESRVDSKFTPLNEVSVLSRYLPVVYRQQSKLYWSPWFGYFSEMFQQEMWPSHTASLQLYHFSSH